MFAQLKTNFKKRRGKFSRGFTLVELLVVLTLVLILSTISINAYLPFVAKSDYQNVVLDVALEIRKFQLFGVGSVQTAGASDPFGVAYGVQAKSTGGYENLIFFFKDTGGGNTYNGAANSCTSECVKMVKMDGYKVVAIKTDTGSSVNTLDVTFKRPYLDAIIYTGGAPSPGTKVVSICIQPNNGDSSINYSKIVISRTGQVSVQPTTSTCL